MDWGPENYDKADNCSAASNSSEETNSDPKSMPSTSPISDLIVFKYCLGGPIERSDLLKEIAISASEEDLAKFSDQISLFSGCSHHRYSNIFLFLSSFLLSLECNLMKLIVG